MPVPAPSPEDDVSAAERARRVQLPLARQMVQTARRLIGERGAAATSTTAIQAGTPGPRREGSSAARGSLFYYFGTKERVLIEVLRSDVAARLHWMWEKAQVWRRWRRERTQASFAGVTVRPS